jgi:hypothetical protein
MRSLTFSILSGVLVACSGSHRAQVDPSAPDARVADGAQEDGGFVLPCTSEAALPEAEVQAESAAVDAARARVTLAITENGGPLVSQFTGIVLEGVDSNQGPISASTEISVLPGTYSLAVGHGSSSAVLQTGIEISGDRTIAVDIRTREVEVHVESLATPTVTSTPLEGGTVLVMRGAYLQELERVGGGVFRGRVLDLPDAQVMWSQVGEAPVGAIVGNVQAPLPASGEVRLTVPLRPLEIRVTQNGDPVPPSMRGKLYFGASSVAWSGARIPLTIAAGIYDQPYVTVEGANEGLPGYAMLECFGPCDFREGSAPSMTLDLLQQPMLTAQSTGTIAVPAGFGAAGTVRAYAASAGSTTGRVILRSALTASDGRFSIAVPEGRQYILTFEPTGGVGIAQLGTFDAPGALGPLAVEIRRIALEVRRDGRALPEGEKRALVMIRQPEGLWPVSLPATGDAAIEVDAVSGTYTASVAGAFLDGRAFRQTSDDMLPPGALETRFQVDDACDRIVLDQDVRRVSLDLGAGQFEPNQQLLFTGEDAIDWAIVDENGRAELLLRTGCYVVSPDTSTIPGWAARYSNTRMGEAVIRALGRVCVE